MQTVEEIRHAWLLRLIEQYGTLAGLNAELDRARNDATLQQIKNRAKNTRTGAPRCMGSELAREIEEKLGMERGRLDNAPLEISEDALDLARAYDKLPPELKVKVQDHLTLVEMAANSSHQGQTRDQTSAS